MKHLRLLMEIMTLILIYFLKLMEVEEVILKKLFKRRCRLVVRKFVYGNRVVDKRNCLSDSCVNCSTLNSFKTNISLELDRKPELNVC